MKLRRTLLFMVSAVLFVGACMAIVHGVGVFLPHKPVPEGLPTTRPEGGGWVDLLDDAHVAGWKNITDGKDIFEIKDRTVHLFGRSLHPLRYVGYAPESFGNFDLHLEFKLAHHTNSGVFLRAQPGRILVQPVLLGDGDQRGQFAKLFPVPVGVGDVGPAALDFGPEQPRDFGPVAAAGVRQGGQHAGDFGPGHGPRAVVCPRERSWATR